jgi:hypothetical protein
MKERTQAIPSTKDGLILMEFSRRDYREAFSRLGGNFLRNTYFLFLDADIETCIERVRQRIIQPRSIHDHFVPDHVICRHCQESNRKYITSGLKLDYGIAEQKVEILDSRGPIEELAMKLQPFVDTILPIPAGVYPSRNF